MRRAYSYGVGLADRLGGEARLTSEMASPSIRAAWFAFCPAGGICVMCRDIGDRPSAPSLPNG